MRVTIDDKWDQPFVMRGSDARIIWDIFQQHVGAVNATAECSDRVTRHFDSVGKLVDYDNHPSRALASLEFRAYGQDRNSYATVRYAPGYERTITLRSEGEERSVSTLRSKLADRHQAMRPWYATIARIRLILLVIAGLFVLLVAAIVASVLGWLPTEPNPAHAGSPRGPSPNDARVLGVFIMTFVGAGILDSLRERCFPSASFALGHGVHRYEIAEKVRWGVVVGFLVSLAAGVLLLLL